jgi:hypothetical protein
MGNQYPTGISMKSGVSRPKFSKLDTKRIYQVFLEMFFSLMYPYIMFHNLSVYGKFLKTIIDIDSTFIRTWIKES